MKTAIASFLAIFLITSVVRAESPPNVVVIVPETTGGHQPSGRTLCQSWLSVTPGSHRTTNSTTIKETP